MLIAAVAVLGVAGYYIASLKASSPSEAKEAMSNEVKRFVTDILIAQYARPISPDARQQLMASYDPSIEEVKCEVARVMAELDSDLKTMEERKAEYRDSKVRVRIRSINMEGSLVTVIAEVLADHHWGYHGRPTETPSQVYGLHELRLIRSDNTWKIVLDRNQASSPKTQVQVTPLEWTD